MGQTASAPQPPTPLGYVDSPRQLRRRLSVDGPPMDPQGCKRSRGNAFRRLSNAMASAFSSLRPQGSSQRSGSEQSRPGSMADNQSPTDAPESSSIIEHSDDVNHDEEQQQQQQGFFTVSPASAQLQEPRRLPPADAGSDPSSVPSPSESEVSSLSIDGTHVGNNQGDADEDGDAFESAPETPEDGQDRRDSAAEIPRDDQEDVQETSQHAIPHAGRNADQNADQNAGQNDGQIDVQNSSENATQNTNHNARYGSTNVSVPPAYDDPHHNHPDYRPPHPSYPPPGHPLFPPRYEGFDQYRHDSHGSENSNGHYPFHGPSPGAPHGPSFAFPQGRPFGHGFPRRHPMDHPFDRVPRTSFDNRQDPPIEYPHSHPHPHPHPHNSTDSDDPEASGYPSREERREIMMITRVLLAAATITAGLLGDVHLSRGELHGQSRPSEENEQRPSFDTFLEQLGRGGYVDELNNAMFAGPNPESGVRPHFFRLFRFPPDVAGQIPLLLVGLRGAEPPQHGRRARQQRPRDAEAATDASEDANPDGNAETNAETNGMSREEAGEDFGLSIHESDLEDNEEMPPLDGFGPFGGPRPPDPADAWRDLGFGNSINPEETIFEEEDEDEDEEDEDLRSDGEADDDADDNEEDEDDEDGNNDDTNPRRHNPHTRHPHDHEGSDEALWRVLHAPHERENGDSPLQALLNALPGPPSPARRRTRQTWVVYVIGGLYSSDHPIFSAEGLLSDDPTYQDLRMVEQLLRPSRPKTLSTRDLDRAGTHKILELTSSLVQDHESCPVCLTEYAEGDSVRELTCNHTFHAPCVDAWLVKQHGTCPLCRKPPVPL